MTFKALSLVMALIASSASAAISVTFTTPTGSVKDHLGADLGIQKLFMVYWTSDASTSGFNSVNPLSPLGGDLLLTSPYSGGVGFDSSNGPDIVGRITGNSALAFGTGSDLYAPGFLYVAVFEMAYTASPSIGAGTYYGLGPVSGALSQRNGVSPSPSPNDYGGLVTAVSPIRTDLQVVPEPSTVAFLGLGLGLVALRRKMVRK